MARETSALVGTPRAFAAKVAEAYGLSPNDVVGFNLRVNGSGKTVVSVDLVPTEEVAAVLAQATEADDEGKVVA